MSGRSPPPLRTIAICAAVALAYVATGRLGLLLADLQEQVTLIWPPTGLAIGSMVLLGPVATIAIFLGAFAVNISASDGPVALALAIAVGNTAEAVVGWSILRRLRFDPALARMRDVLCLLLVAPTASLVSATIGVGALSVGGQLSNHDFAGVWIRWWAGDTLGALIVIPLVTLTVKGAPEWSSLYRRVEAWLVAGLITLGSVAAFLIDWNPFLQSTVALSVLVLMVWAGLRMGPRGAVLAGALASAIAVVGTGRGLGPFAVPDLSMRILLLWSYVATNAALVLVLAATVAEREAAIEQRVNAEREAREIAERMRHAQRLESLGVLAGGVAHDFNNLLTVIVGNAHLVPLARSSEQRDEYLQNIQAASQRAADLCQQLLSYSGKAKAERKPVRLEAMTEEVKTLLVSTLTRDIELDIDVEEGLSPVSGDPKLLQQIVLNLLMNAVEAIGDEGGHVKLRLSERELSRDYLQSSFLPSEIEPGNYVVLSVSDDGQGMDPETMERVFDPFFTTKFSGRGLGLAAVLGVVHAHQGAIKVRSEPGRGTTFDVLLPPSTAEEIRPSTLDSTPIVLEGTWLVVDDEAQIRRFVSRLLEEFGAHSREADNGSDAIDLLSSELPRLAGLIVDLTMPGANGHAVIEATRRRHPHLPVVLMSGFPMAEGLRDDVVFIQKPFTASELATCLRDACRRVGAAETGARGKGESEQAVAASPAVDPAASR